MKSIDWREAVPEDAEALSALGAATFLATFAHDHPGPALLAHLRDAHSVAYYRAALADRAQTLLIGETPLKAPVAYMVLTPPDLPIPTEPERDVEIKRLYLLPDWHGGGHGDRAMSLAVAQATAHGAKRLLLAVYPRNDRARGFYARHGFEQIGETRFMVGDTAFTDLIYARPL
ncbi:MAG: GNAT family N-acetyltransferase [Sphingobium sp.]